MLGICLIVQACNNRSRAERCIRRNYKWPGAEEDWEPIRSRLACQPKTNCLLALTAGFYLHNSNPRAKQSALCQHTQKKITGRRVYKRHMGRHGERNPRTKYTSLDYRGRESRLDRNQTLIRCKHLHGCTFCPLKTCTLSP